MQDVRVYSDAMDWLLAENIAAALKGCRFNLQDLTSALEQKLDAEVSIRRNLQELLEKQSI